MKISVRFGIEGWMFFKNATIFVFKLKESDYTKFEEAVLTLKAILYASGQSAVADKIVFERR